VIIVDDRKAQERDERIAPPPQAGVRRPHLKETPHLALEEKHEKFLKILLECKGIATNACKKAKMAYTTHMTWQKNVVGYKERVTEIQEQVIDFVESKLFENIADNETQSILFFLKTRGKTRGYHADQQQIVADIVINVVPPKFDDNIVDAQIV
jgi:hypothetical protein